MSLKRTNVNVSKKTLLLIFALFIAFPISTTYAEVHTTTRVTPEPMYFSSEPTFFLVNETFQHPFDKQIPMPKYESNAYEDLVAVELIFTISLDRYQYVTASGTCSSVEGVNKVSNTCLYDDVAMELHTPNVNFSFSFPMVGWTVQKDCDVTDNCTTSDDTPLSYTQRRYFTNPSQMQDFIGTDDFYVRFLGVPKYRATSTCVESQPAICDIPGVQCFDSYVPCCGGSAEASMTFRGQVTVNYHYAAAVVGNYVCPNPVADAGGPYTGFLNTPIIFDAGGSYFDCYPPDPYPSAFISSIEWDWDGDGVFDEVGPGGPFTEHTFNSEYHGYVNLRVWGIGPGGSYAAVDSAWVDVTPGDLDGDSDVDNDDLALFQAAFGSSSGDANYNPAADLDNDGVIGVSDLLIFRSMLNP